MRDEGVSFRPGDVASISPLIMAVVIGILLGVVEFGFFMGLWYVVIVLAYAFWISANYFIEIIEFKAVGHDDWPVFSLDTLVAGRNQAGIAFFAIVLVATAIVFALQYAERDSFAMLVLVAVLIGLPASAALMAVTRNLFSALNPISVLAAMGRMGPGYLLCLASSAAMFALLWLAWTRGGAWYFPLAYGLFLQAYLIGRVVYARRLALGVQAPRSPEAKAARVQGEIVAVRRSVLSHAYGFAAHGNRAGALKHIDAYLDETEDSLEARLWMLNEMARWEDTSVAGRFCELLVESCEQTGMSDEADRLRNKYAVLLEARARTRRL